MLLWLTQTLEQVHSGFGVFQYLTLRAILGVLTALAISLLVGPAMIRRLTRDQIGQTVRDDGPESHLTKAGTPTMGGALILVAIAVATLLWGDLSNRFVWVVLITTVVFGAIGWVDDYRKLIQGDPKGLPARYKYLWQSVFALGCALFLFYSASTSSETELIVPFFKNVALELGWFYIVLTYFVIVGSSNAVNLTDGLDGLAILPTVMVAGALGIFAYVTGNSNFATYLGFPFINGVGEVVVFCGAIVGSGLGFLGVQHLSRPGVHGGYRCLGLGRGARRGGGGRAPGAGTVDHGWRIRDGNGVGYSPGRLFQAHRATHLSHGAAAPSLRAKRLAGAAGHRALLGNYRDPGVDRSRDAQDSMT